MNGATRRRGTGFPGSGAVPCAGGGADHVDGDEVGRCGRVAKDRTREAVRGGGDGPWKQVGAEWRDVVLVCRKCARKRDGGFGPGGDLSLAKALRQSLDAGEPRKVKPRRRAVAVIEVGCLDICPKHAVVAVNCSRPQSIVLVPDGAGMDEVRDRLGLGAAVRDA